MPYIQKPVKIAERSKSVDNAQIKPVKKNTVQRSKSCNDQQAKPLVGMRKFWNKISVTNSSMKPTEALERVDGSRMVSRKEKTGTTKKHHSKKKRLATISPQQYLESVQRNRGYPVDKINALDTAFCTETSPLQQASYQTFLIDAAEEEPVVFRSLLATGLSPNPCNKDGDSLLNNLCSRCNNDALRTLIQAGCELRVCDKNGRTPLHHVFSGELADFETVDLIMDYTKGEKFYLFNMVDSTGATPLSYIKPEEWSDWIEYLVFRNW